MAKRVGVLAVARPSYGGTYNYTRSMIEGLQRIPNIEFTVYAAADNSHYDTVGLPIRRMSSDRLLKPTLFDLLHIPLPDPFEDEDVVLAPVYSPYLLHTRRAFCYTLHDLQEHYYPQNFSRPQRIWRRYINARLAARVTVVLCEVSIRARRHLSLCWTP